MEPAAPFAAPTALDDLGDFAITDMTTLDQDEVGKGMILVGEVTIGDGGNLLLFAKSGKVGAGGRIFGTKFYVGTLPQTRGQLLCEYITLQNGITPQLLVNY